MTDLVLVALASIGLCHVMVDGSLLLPIKGYLGRRGWKRVENMLNCYQCAGFWAGLAAGLVLLLTHWVPELRILLYGLAASFLGPLAAVTIGALNALGSAGTLAPEPLADTEPAVPAPGSNGQQKEAVAHTTDS
jgi:hypothetical protein